MRRFGEPVDPRRTYRDRLGAYAVIRDGNDVLVTEQAAPQREFQLPGGGVDPGEGMLAALHRECLEETGWRIRVLRRLGAFQRYVYMPEYDVWARKVCSIYLARPVVRLGAPSERGHAAVWMPIATAIALIANDGDRAFLRSVAGE
jgi:8-oxo-dGTP diphosphatase